MKGVPPKANQFKPGQSGNPRGKQKGTLSLKTYIKKWLDVEEDLKNPVTGISEQLTQFDIIVLHQIVKAKKGDTRAFEALLDRVEGKPKQSFDVDQSVSWNETKTYVDYTKLSPGTIKEIMKHTHERE